MDIVRNDFTYSTPKVRFLDYPPSKWRSANCGRNDVQSRWRIRYAIHILVRSDDWNNTGWGSTRYPSGGARRRGCPGRYGLAYGGDHPAVVSGAGSFDRECGVV